MFWINAIELHLANFNALVLTSTPTIFTLFSQAILSMFVASSSSAIILADEILDLNVPGISPSAIILDRLYLTVPRVPPILGSVANISNKV